MPVIFPVSPRGTTAWLSSGLNLELKSAGATPADAPLVMGGGDGEGGPLRTHQDPGDPLTVPGSKRKLISSRTWATRTAQDRLAWMW